MITEIQLTEMLNQFGSIWPSMGATMSHDQKMGYVVQLATALAENGLDNAESIREGYRKARTEGGQYLPSVPEFVRWCKVAHVEPSHKLLPRLENTEATPEQCAEFITSIKVVMKGIK